MCGEHLQAPAGAGMAARPGGLLPLGFPFISVYKTTPAGHLCLVLLNAWKLISQANTLQPQPGEPLLAPNSSPVLSPISDKLFPASDDTIPDTHTQDPRLPLGPHPV